MKCWKCGADFSPTDMTKAGIAKAVSDHASKLGCDYPAGHIKEVTKQLKKGK